MFLGFVTGKLDKVSYLEKIKIFKELNCNALEIGLLDANRFDEVKNSLSKVDYTDFKYLSLHAPALYSNEKYYYKNDKQTRQILEEISWLHKKFNFPAIVLHPNRVKDWPVIREYDLPWAIENLSDRASFGSTISDLEKVFKEDDYKMVLDLNHCLSVDPTSEFARKMVDIFSDRIVEVHLSGYVGYHDLLCQTKQIELIKIASQLNVPVIIESVCNTVEEYRMEYKYIIENI